MTVLISRSEARAAGLARYYTGKPCKHGHVVERRTHNCECCECAHIGSHRYMAKQKKNDPHWAGKKSKARAYTLSQNPFDDQVTTAKEMFRRIRGRAKKKGLIFSLLPEDVIPLPTHCPVLGIKLYYFRSGRTEKDNAASIDRVDNTKGYEPGNVRVISYRANHIKTDATLDELCAVLKYVEDNYYG